MSQFSEDPLETLDDWNAILSNGYCCTMPECPIPSRECEQINGFTYINYVIDVSGTLYKKARYDYADGGFTQQEVLLDHWVTLGGDTIVEQDIINTDGDPKTGAITPTYSNIVDVAASIASGFSAMDAALDWDTMTLAGTGCSAGAAEQARTYCRFKWTIPDTFEGTYFKITWDVVTFPDTGDPVAVSTDNTWEWTGPGDPEDEDSWKSGWYDIAVPGEPGETRVVNIRFECYTGPYGHMPQVTGEAYEYP